MAYRVVLAAAGALLASGASAQSDPRPAQVLAAIGEETGPDSRYAIAFSDLNDDHRQEALVHLAGSNHCGSGGCQSADFRSTGCPIIRAAGTTLAFPSAAAE